jgi:hypothetical protein
LERQCDIIKPVAFIDRHWRNCSRCFPGWKSPVLIFLIVVSLTQGLPCRAQDSDFVTGGFQYTPGPTVRKYIAGAAAGGLLVGTMIGSYFEWWNRDHASFHFLHEGWFSDYSVGIDKIGPLYTGYFYFHTFRNLLLWGGNQPATAFWWSAGLATFFTVSIEVGDGLSSWGFSFEDVAADLMGIGYGILQTQSPILRNFNLKWSYVPSNGYRWPPHLTANYDAHTYWVTVNVHNLLPTTMRSYWPEFQQLAAGYGVDDHQTKHEAVIGLDFNLNIFQPESDIVKLLQREISMIHLPAPAVKFTEHKNPRYYLFQLN